ncbi:MAG: hypothetical protein QM756_27310 [Polyangiaceae bacterium]
MRSRSARSLVLSISQIATLTAASSALVDCGGDGRNFHSSGGSSGTESGGSSNGGVHSSGGQSVSNGGSSNGGQSVSSGGNGNGAGGSLDGSGGEPSGVAGAAGADGAEAGAGGSAANGGTTATSGGTTTASGGTTANSGGTTATSGGKATSGGTSAASGGNGSGGACTMLCNDNGTACNISSQCKSGRCVDGVCCDAACDGPCEACSAALTGGVDGLCSSVKTGTDPGNDCAAEDVSTCGQTGMCGPNKTCALYATSAVCKAGSCAAGSAQSERKCDGAGTCKTGTTTTCAPYICGSTACLGACTANSQCSTGNVCIAGTCRAPSGLLGPCDEVADCSRGQCLSSVCALYVTSINISGAAVSGGGGQIFLDGWFKSDANGQNRTRIGTLSVQQYLWGAIDVTTPLSPQLAPNSYVLLTGSEGSVSITRSFQFNLSDGTSVTKSVQAARSDNMLLYPDAVVGSGDPFVLFQWTGADVNVLTKTY